ALIVGVIAVLVIAGAGLFVMVGKRRTEAYEEEMDVEESAEVKRQALERTRDAIKDLADEWEGDLAEGETKAKAETAGWEAEGEGLEEIDMGVTEDALSMNARVTEEDSDDVAKLFSGVSGAETEGSAEEKESMRLENEKRQYQNAIGRLPYGIPSKELAEMDWVDLANCLATGEKRTVEGDREVTRIDGRWYYSDPEDSSTFLKEHGAKPKEVPRKVPEAGPTVDREKLMAKLEERFIMGEISEDTYKQLMKKYGGQE
ncbi:MAG: hypothetical protein KAQ96_10675, partial [Thermoplasmata archaeon]|nr:hypothetical protein [Thermoplasmata archaeon]